MVWSGSGPEEVDVLWEGVSSRGFSPWDLGVGILDVPTVDVPRCRGAADEGVGIFDSRRRM